MLSNSRYRITPPGTPSSRSLLTGLAIAAGLLLAAPFPRASILVDKASPVAATAKSHRAKARSSGSDLLGSAFRRDRNGWVYIHLEGTPDQIGYQHGYLLAPEIKEVLRVFGEYLPHTTKRDWQFYRQAAHSMFWDKIGEEYQREISGIARGANDRLNGRSANGGGLHNDDRLSGGKSDGGTESRVTSLESGVEKGVKIDQDDILALNAWIELAQYYVPSLQARVNDPELHQSPPPSCSAFIATGSWTRDGQIVIGHNNWIDYLIGRHWNVMVDLKPAAGHRILMDAFPGFIHSGDDFYVTDAGLMATETTITQFKGFDTTGVPEFYRIRKAIQYSDSIDDWLKVMTDHPNGGYANDWLVGDRKTGEIARLENGIKNNIVERTRDGYYVGSNFPVNEKTIREETSFDPNSANNSANARHRRWDELMKQYKGKIDSVTGRRFEADHYDVVRKRWAGSGNTLCGHVEVEAPGLPEWDWARFYPGGTVNAKVTDSRLAEKMTLWASVGHACGAYFNEKQFLSRHPEYGWQRKIAGDMQGGPWTLFSITPGGRYCQIGTGAPAGGVALGDENCRSAAAAA